MHREMGEGGKNDRANGASQKCQMYTIPVEALDVVRG